MRLGTITAGSRVRDGWRAGIVQYLAGRWAWVLWDKYGCSRVNAEDLTLIANV